jgi:sortase A
MTFTIEHEMVSTRMRRLARWSQRLLVITGALALGYVGFTLVDASLFQASAKRNLETQIRQEQAHPEPQAKSAVKIGDVLGRVEIPRLGISVAVLQGTSSRMLRLGAGHIEGTALPGEPGNSGIAGHRDTFFRELKDIQLNDEIQIQTATGLSRYQVDWMRVVEPGDTTVLEPSKESTVTLVTCYPFYFVGSAPKRFVVRAHQY